MYIKVKIERVDPTVRVNATELEMYVSEKVTTNEAGDFVQVQHIITEYLADGTLKEDRKVLYPVALADSVMNGFRRQVNIDVLNSVLNGQGYNATEVLQ